MAENKPSAKPAAKKAAKKETAKKPAAGKPAHEGTFSIRCLVYATSWQVSHNPERGRGHNRLWNRFSLGAVVRGRVRVEQLLQLRHHRILDG